jgi:hypothetical protein
VFYPIDDNLKFLITLIVLDLQTEQDILGIGSKLNTAYLCARKGIQAKPTIDSLLQKGLKNT